MATTPNPAERTRRPPGARTASCAAVLAVGLAVAPILTAPLAGQSVLHRTPNLEDGWTVRPGVVQFNFLHRFTSSDPPARKVTSFPTFVFATGLPAGFGFGVKYATNSAVFEGIPNEHEIWLRRAFLSEAGNAPLDLSLTGAYNSAAQSGDGELSLARTLGPVRLLGALRGMSRGYDTERSLWGAGAGAVVRVTPWLALAGDVFSILSEEEDDDFEPAWGAAAQIGIPSTPHTLSLQVVNTNTASIQGSSRGSGPDFTFGFEFTIPITLSRYFGPRAPDASGRGRAGESEAADSAGAAQGAARDFTVQPPARAGSALEVQIRDLAFDSPELRVHSGTRVRWVNRDQLEHSVTADGGEFDSGAVAPGKAYERIFDRPGIFAYHCTPHPFMRATVIVQ